jgi:hypothetical protein
MLEVGIEAEGVLTDQGPIAIVLEVMVSLAKVLEISMGPIAFVLTALGRGGQVARRPRVHIGCPHRHPVGDMLFAMIQR